MSCPTQCPPGAPGEKGPKGETGGANPILFGIGDPNGVVAAPPKMFYKDTVTGLLWLKQTGTGNTGWI